MVTPRSLCRSLLCCTWYWAVIGGPARRFRIPQIEQYRLNFLNVAVLNGEELGYQPVVRRRDGLALRAAFQAQTDDEEYHAALFVHHRITAVPDIAAGELALVEAACRVVEHAIACQACGLEAVFEAYRVRQQTGAVIVRSAIRLEGAPIAVGGGDQIEVRVPRRFAAPGQNVSASFFAEPFSVMRAFAAWGSTRASWASSALK